MADLIRKDRVQQIVDAFGVSWVPGKTLGDLQQEWGTSDEETQSIYRSALARVRSEIGISRADTQETLVASLWRLSNLAAKDKAYDSARKCLADIGKLSGLALRLKDVLADLSDAALEIVDDGSGDAP